MTIIMKASVGQFALPREFGGAPNGASSSEPALSNSKTKGSLLSSGSRRNTRFQGQKRNGYNKHRNDTVKQPQHAPQPQDGRRQGEAQHQGQRQYQRQFSAPANVIREIPDYFNYNASNEFHAPGRIHSDACGFGPQPMGPFPTLPPSHPIFMSVPPSPPRMGQLIPSSMPLEAFTAEFQKHRVWDELEEAASVWLPPQHSLDPFVDPVKSWTMMRSSQAGYQPLYHQRSTLRPWANEFVPGRLFHPILGW